MCRMSTELVLMISRSDVRVAANGSIERGAWRTLPARDSLLGPYVPLSDRCITAPERDITKCEEVFADATRPAPTGRGTLSTSTSNRAAVARGRRIRDRPDRPDWRANTSRSFGSQASRQSRCTRSMLGWHITEVMTFALPGALSLTPFPLRKRPIGSH
jgi:hypothetical protein